MCLDPFVWPLWSDLPLVVVIIGVVKNFFLLLFAKICHVSLVSPRPIRIKHLFGNLTPPHTSNASVHENLTTRSLGLPSPTTANEMNRTSPTLRASHIDVRALFVIGMANSICVVICSNVTTTNDPVSFDVALNVDCLTTTSSETTMSSPNIVCCLKTRCALKRQVQLGQSIQLMGCHVLGCTKSLNYVCYQGSVLNCNGLDPISVTGSNGSDKEQICCSKKCYDKLKKESDRMNNAAKGRVYWHNDGKNGDSDPITSEKILLDWLLTEGNYAKFRGKDNHGTKKIHFAAQIAQQISAAGVLAVRTPKKVLNKIENIQQCMKSAERGVPITFSNCQAI